MLSHVTSYPGGLGEEIWRRRREHPTCNSKTKLASLLGKCGRNEMRLVWRVVYKIVIDASKYHMIMGNFL